MSRVEIRHGREGPEHDHTSRRDSVLLELRRALRTAREDEDAFEVLALALMRFGHGSTEVRGFIEQLREHQEKFRE